MSGHEAIGTAENAKKRVRRLANDTAELMYGSLLHATWTRALQTALIKQVQFHLSLSSAPLSTFLVQEHNQQCKSARKALKILSWTDFRSQFIYFLFWSLALVLGWALGNLSMPIGQKILSSAKVMKGDEQMTNKRNVLSHMVTVVELSGKIWNVFPICTPAMLSFERRLRSRALKGRRRQLFKLKVLKQILFQPNRKEGKRGKNNSSSSNALIMHIF